ncbi:hypothetical protein ECVR50_1405 [Escherichia coli VR50]|nr:hypothetical protein ECVR50_1405 [Escherichia coli VR50]DAL01965.1 MAG TPA: hypothetical protein [Caudoviricetes sp.]
MLQIQLVIVFFETYQCGTWISIPPPIISWAVHSNTIAYASIRGCLCSQQDIVFNSAQKRPRNIRGQ